MTDHSTIAAIATPPGVGGVGVIRVSGPLVGQIMGGLLARVPAPRRAVLAAFRDGTGEALDQGIALYFPAPNSYTGEDVLEIQAHGGPVVLQRLLLRCFELGARPAQPGEFTQRAYLNDKLDLAQAESVADLINAATSQAARGAMRSLEGAFSRRIARLSDGLVELRAFLEATLDFPEEETDFLEHAGVESRLEELGSALDTLLVSSRQGSLLREGIRVVLAGQPNVGKSSLLNRLAGEELAIVTEVPGTTRDVIRQTVSLEGIPTHIIDTAGLRDSEDPVEQAGMERTRAAIVHADVVVLLMDATAGEQSADRAILASAPPALPRIRVMNKIDLLSGESSRARRSADRVWLSARTGSGVELLCRAVLETVGWQGVEGEGLFMARERHVRALQKARTHVSAAALESRHLELMAEELRAAHTALGAITGEYTPDDLLGEIFSRFCIGK